jgi:CRP/FNR family transcriptional regulator, cyclic AMP receptor protein
MSHRETLRDALAVIPLFDGCSKRDLRIVARHMQVVALDPGTTIMREGEQGDACYVALDGVADIERGGMVVASVSAGDHVGELALLDPQPRSATVTARTAMIVGVLDARTFAAIVRDLPAFNAKLLRTLARRLREADRRASH